MADNKNNLEGFFKNRINDFDGSNDGWDLPDESAWENAQTHFPKHPQKETWNWKLGALILLVFSMVSAGGYIHYLKKDLVKKSIEIENAQNEIENKNNTITSLEKEVSKVESELKKEKLNTQIAITSLTQQQQIATQTILSHQKTNQFLRNENQKINKELILTQVDFNSKTESNFSSRKNVELNYSIKDSKTILKNSIPIASSFIQISNIFPIRKLDLESEFNAIFPKQKKEKGIFEVGVNYASSIIEIPVFFNFEKLEKENLGNKNYTFPIKSSGGSFQIAYSVFPKIWITAGVRRTIGGFEKNFSDKLIYDKSSEYLDAEGKTINEFDITTQSGFGDSGSTINFEIPIGTAIDDGDFVETNWIYSQQYKFTNLPIGIKYFMGKNKLQWFIKGGLGWNKVSFGEYFVEAKLSYDNDILPIKENAEIKKIEVNSQFMSAFAGTGLNYQLTSSWNARTSFILEKNFNQRRFIASSNSLNKVFDFGLSYRF